MNEWDWPYSSNLGVDQVLPANPSSFGQILVSIHYYVYSSCFYGNGLALYLLLYTLGFFPT